MIPVPHHHLYILAIAWIVGDLLMPILIEMARRNRWLDRPYGHKTHRDPTPVLGGVGIYLAIVAALAATVRFSEARLFEPLLGIWIGASLVLVLGLIDDIHPINAVVKLAVLMAATLVISSFGVSISIFPGGWGDIINILVTLFWIAGVTSAANSLDHWNGTTAGSMAIACGTVFIMTLGDAGTSSQVLVSSVTIAVVGACAGFLRHNLSGGKIFLGDNGSFLLGFVVASSLVFADWSRDPLKAMILPPIVLTVPLFDITLSTFFRIKNGVVGSLREAIVYCGKDHLAHRLSALGFGARTTVLIIYGMGLTSGAFALAIHGLESRMAYLSVFGTYLMFLASIAIVLDRAKVHGTRGRKAESPSPPRAQAPHHEARKKSRTQPPAVTAV